MPPWCNTYMDSGDNQRGVIGADPNWVPEAASGVGRSHGTSRTVPFDRWFRYPAGFASDYVGLLLDQMGVSDGTVTDSFAGSGVTGTAARGRGMNFTGIEAHPLIAELAALKLNPQPPQPSQLIADGREIVRLARKRINAGRANTSTEPDLVTRSFAPGVLLQLVELRGLIARREHWPNFRYLKWALLATLRDVAAVKVGWPYQRPGVARNPRHADALVRFAARVSEMAEDLGVAGMTTFTGTVVNGDSRSELSWRQLPGTAQACVSSPPYLNNFDYADATRLELYFWGEVTTWRAMCNEVRIEMLTATTQQSSKAEKELALAHLADDTGPVGSKVLSIVNDLARVREDGPKVRSKAYDQVVPPYFVAMWQVLENLFTYLDPGSPAIWLIGDSAPYGVYIDTPALIGEFAALVGFEVKEDVVLRRRGGRWASNRNQAQSKLTERALVLRRP